jgi:hypothetical protein
MTGKDMLPPPPRAPILRFCITRKEFTPAPLFEGAPLRRRTGPPGRPNPRGRETVWVPTPGTVAGSSAPGFVRFPCTHVRASIRRVSDRVGRWIPPLGLPAIRLPTRGEQAGRARGRNGALEGLRLEGATPVRGGDSGVGGEHPARTKSAALAVRTISRTGREKRRKPQQINTRAEENSRRQSCPNRTLGPMNPTGDEPKTGGVDWGHESGNANQMGPTERARMDMDTERPVRGPAGYSKRGIPTFRRKPRRGEVPDTKLQRDRPRDRAALQLLPG